MSSDPTWGEMFAADWRHAIAEKRRQLMETQMNEGAARLVAGIDRMERIAMALYAHDIAQPGGHMLAGVASKAVTWLEAHDYVRQFYHSRARAVIEEDLP